MLMALILVCSLSVTPDLSACTRANAIDVVRAPAEFGNPATCFMHGQAYLAETEMGKNLGANERVKVICARVQLVGSSTPQSASYK